LESINSESDNGAEERVENGTEFKRESHSSDEDGRFDTKLLIGAGLQELLCRPSITNNDELPWLSVVAREG
jgi:hypothetical protein